MYRSVPYPAGQLALENYQHFEVGLLALWFVPKMSWLFWKPLS